MFNKLPKQDFLKKNLELHINTSDDVTKNKILVADGTKLSAFSEKG